MTAGPTVVIRAAEADDAGVVAALHAASWRAHYRGSLGDTYLDGPIVAERLVVWTGRLARPAANQRVRLALAGGELVGFVCLFLDDDPVHGTLIDNLHVAVAAKRVGIGRRLMHAAALAVWDALPGRPIHLYVLEANRAAQGFYDRIGGTAVEWTSRTQPDGSSNPVLRYRWASPDALIAATSA